MAYAYYLMDIAYYKLGYEDSARLCLKKIPSIIESVDKREKPYFVSGSTLRGLKHRTKPI